VILSKVFYNTTGTWYTSPFPGSLMMRAVFGTAAEFTGVNNMEKQSIDFSVYPNPANDRLFIKMGKHNSSKLISYSIVDMYGRTVAEEKVSAAESIDISNLSEGIYFIRLKDEATISTNKFIKIK
jgi:hypothetical protein